MSERTPSSDPAESLWGVFGHDWAVEHLRQTIRHNRVRHAYLIVGAESVGKSTVARAFAAALLCTVPDVDQRPCGECPSCRRIASGNHPDLLFTERGEDETTLTIDSIRAQIGRLSLKPFEGRFRFGIFPDFDQVRPQAQDALLKTLEEPAPHAILILLARSIEQILPTITSRSQLLHLRPASVETVQAVLRERYGADADTAALLAHLSGGRIGWAIRALQDPDSLARRSDGLDLLMDVLNANRAGRFAPETPEGSSDQGLRRATI
ncbi:MAG: DNA polymerase III subunit [Chloroflexi bacterium]|nr:DNA polymerase III subunit [Chloroflexota bacterium]